MSNNYTIGLSREQVEKLLNGETVGKRPYNSKYARDEVVVYDGTLRIYVKMLSESEEAKEPEGAFTW